MADPDGVNTKLIDVLAAFTAELNAVGLLHTDLQSVASYLDGIQTDMHTELEAIRTQVADVQAVLGFAAGGPTTTLAGLLTIIAGNTACVQRACAPGGDDADGCVDPSISTAQATNTLYPGRNFATWVFDSLPDGITLGSFLDHDVVQVQLVHAAGSGWKAYVQSNGAASYSINPDAGHVFSTNQWTDVSAYTNMAFNVPDSADIKVYLCIPAPATWGDCQEIAALPALATTAGGSTANIHYIPMSALAGVHYADRHQDSANSGHYMIDQPDYVATDNWHGVTVTLVSGTGVRFFYQRADFSFVVFFYTAVGESHTITEDTIAAAIDNWTGGANNAFTVEVCPPEPL